MNMNNADLIFTNAIIYTMDPKRSIAESIAIKNGRIVFLGSDTDAKAWIDDRTEVIDLEGRLVLPSFLEAHAHASSTTELVCAVDITSQLSLDGYLKTIKEFVGSHPGLKMLKGAGWRNTVFSNDGPKKEDLDLISCDIPIAIWSEDHHSVWANSKALQLAGITKNTPSPDGGIQKNADGEPTGTLRESAGIFIMNELPEFTVEEYETGIKAYQEMAHSLGYTAFFDPWLYLNSNAIKAYKNLAAKNELHCRVRGAYYGDPAKGAAQVGEFTENRKTDNAGELFQISAVKIFADGVVEGNTAYLLEPYADQSDFRGKPIWDPDDLSQMCAALEQAGFQVHVHSIGDAATKEVLDALAYAEQQNGKGDYRNGITHLQLVDPPDIKRLKDLDVVAVINPYWATKDDYYFMSQVPSLGQKRADLEYPVKSLFDAGIICASASDYPVTNPLNPLFGIETGITRMNPLQLRPILLSEPDDPRFDEPLWPEESATLEEMIASFTWNAAYSMRLEKETGSLEVGKSADMIVLSEDLFSIKASDINRAKVLLTLFQGRKVYSDSRFSNDK
jgi:predicted amidohydrolase YtcJ